MRFSFSILFVLGCFLGSGLTYSERDETETISPYSVVDYRILLKHPQLRAAVNPKTAASFYFEKLNIDYPMEDLDSIRQMPLHMLWNDEWLSNQLYVRNMYACELEKTRLGQQKFKYHDKVTDFGLTACFNQCLAENDQYYQLLSSKLQELTYKNPVVDVALNAPKHYSGEEKIWECTRLLEKRYKCNCFYNNYQVKVGPEFELVFGKVLREAREVTTGFTDEEELEAKYGVPVKLVGFLILYHLIPDQMYEYLLWWTNSESAPQNTSAP